MIIDFLKLSADENLRALSFRNFSSVFSFAFSMDTQKKDGSYFVTLILDTEQLPINYRIHLEFRSVRELRIKHFGSKPTQITGFSISDVSSSQMENIRYKVNDYENDNLYFLCASGEVLKIEALDRL